MPITDSQVNILAKMDGNTTVSIQRLPPTHREANKIYVSYTNASIQETGEFFLTDAEFGQYLQQTANRILTPG